MKKGRAGTSFISIVLLILAANCSAAADSSDSGFLGINFYEPEKINSEMVKLGQIIGKESEAVGPMTSLWVCSFSFISS
ncbi:MAG: hypothetical protein ACYDHX_04315 [Methanothrix sp.]